MKFLPMLLHSIGFNFRCGGKLDLTSEGGHLGFSKMAAVFSFFFNFSASISPRVLISVSKPTFSGARNPVKPDSIG